MYQKHKWSDRKYHFKFKYNPMSGETVPLGPGYWRYVQIVHVVLRHNPS
jgi:hypothetical protein